MSYASIRKWITKHKPKPVSGLCEDCNKRQYRYLVNVTRKYTRDFANWKSDENKSQSTGLHDLVASASQDVNELQSDINKLQSEENKLKSDMTELQSEENKNSSPK